MRSEGLGLAKKASSGCNHILISCDCAGIEFSPLQCNVNSPFLRTLRTFFLLGGRVACGGFGQRKKQHSDVSVRWNVSTLKGYGERRFETFSLATNRWSQRTPVRQGTGVRGLTQPQLSGYTHRIPAFCVVCTFQCTPVSLFCALMHAYACLVIEVLFYFL